MDFIQFPGLWGLRFNISRVAFWVFGIPIYWYGIIIASGFLLAVLLGMKDSRKYGLDPDNIIDLVLYAAPVAIITARLYYVAFSWDSFKDNPIEIFNTRKGGLAIYGAVIGAVIIAYIFAKKKKIGFRKLFDFASPYLVLAQGIGRWGNFVNQEAYGTQTTLPWGMTGSSIGDIPVHPTFLYESLWDFGVFFFLLWFRRRKKLDGEVFSFYMILYGVGRFWIEGLRTDSLMMGSIRISQMLSAIFAIVFAVIFIIRRKKHVLAAADNAEVGSSEYGAVLEKLQKDEADNSISEASTDADSIDDGLIDEGSEDADLTDDSPANEDLIEEASSNEDISDESPKDKASVDDEIDV